MRASRRRRRAHRRAVGVRARRAGRRRTTATAAARSTRCARAVTDEDFYFVMADRFENGDTANDTGGLGSDRLVSGFDPTAKGFYNGGDLKGLLKRIDYIQGLGTDSIWLTPSFKNKAVQLEDGPSAGYHGYWITDFTQIDPHLGTNDDLQALIEAAHERGMKVYFDIITNHTADVIGYEGEPAQGLHQQGRRAVQDRRRHRLRRPRLRRPQQLPGPRRRHELPLHARAGAGRGEPQGPGLAQRRHALPQPRQHDVRRRELALRRLRRPRRPVHREPARRAAA